MLLLLQLNNLLEEEAESDTTPDAFSFVDQTGVARSTVITSSSIVVTGIDAAAAISISGGDAEYSVNFGAWTSVSGTVVNGDLVRVRITSSASYSTAANAVLTIGGVSDTFTATTLANSAPVFVGPDIDDKIYTVDVPIAPVDFSLLFTDADTLTFSVVGTLPTGLSLSSAGVLSGTPTVLGPTTSLEIRATDSGSLTADSDSFNILVLEPGVGGGGVRNAGLSLSIGLHL